MMAETKINGISVVIPSYNGRNLLGEVLDALYKALLATKIPFEVIICDDKSTDDSVAFIRQHYPQVKLILNEKNSGFSPTINRGIRQAQYELVFLLNSDVKIFENYFESQFKYFENEDTFGVMGRILNWNDDGIQDGAKFPTFHGVKIKTTGNYIAENPNPNDWLYSMYLSGANALVDRNKLITLGGFDELYAPFYVEDYDLSLRAWRAGWKCYYEHFSICRHQVSVTIKSKNSKNFIKTIYYRNKMYLHFIHLNAIELSLWFLQLIPELFFSLLTGKFYFIKSLRLFFSSIKKANQSKIRLYANIKESKNPRTLKEVTNLILNSIKQKRIKII